MCGNLRLWNNSRVEIKRVANTGEAPELDAIGVSIVSGGGGATIIIPTLCKPPHHSILTLVVWLAGR